MTRCVAFSGASLTGEQVLARSGLEYQTVAFGGLSDAVCQVDGEPATFPPTCWTGSSLFWELFVARKGGAWSWSSLGMSALVLHDGDSEGLRYEPQASTLPPAGMGNCPSSTPTPRPTPKPTPLPTPLPTARATATPAPSAKPGSTPAAGGALDQPSPTPSTGGSAASSAPAAATFGATIAGLGSSPTPTGSTDAAGSTGAGSGSDGNGSPALPIAVVAIVGLAGLATLRRRPRAGSRPR